MIPDGQLRWVQDYNSIQPETPPYHLSFNGHHTLCGEMLFENYEGSLYEQPLGVVPQPPCRLCQAVMRENLGL